MTRPLLTNWLPATIIALLLASSYRLDGPADWQAEQAQLASLQGATKNEAARARYLLAASQMCGNADFVEVDATTIQCIPRHGKGLGGAVQVAGVTP